MPNEIIYWQWEREISPEVCARLISENRKNLQAARTVGPGGQDMIQDRRRSRVNFDVTTEVEEMCLHYLWLANRDAFGFDLWPNEKNRNFKSQFLEYNAEEKGHFDWHQDSYHHGTARSNRKLTLICQLTDPSEYKGGELDIGMGGVPLRLGQGTIVVFPSYMIHRVSPVTEGRRNSLVAWVEGPEWK